MCVDFGELHSLIVLYFRFSQVVARIKNNRSKCRTRIVWPDTGKRRHTAVAEFVYMNTRGHMKVVLVGQGDNEGEIHFYIVETRHTFQQR